MLDIQDNIKVKLDEININNYPKIIAVSKTFKIDHISPLIDHGHKHFGENKIQEALQTLTKGKTTIVIAHRLSTILNANNIYLIDNGRVVENGKHEVLMEKSKLYKSFYEKQIQK